MYYAFLFCSLIFFIGRAIANTEIANFEVGEERNFDIWFVREW